MSRIRLCRDDDRGAILAIVNAAAEAYRGVIPDDCWHEPYMPARELEGEIAAGVEFWGYEVDNALAGVMGVQPVHDVDLIRCVNEGDTVVVEGRVDQITRDDLRYDTPFVGIFEIRDGLIVAYKQR